MLYQLICEGPKCNPALKALDAEIEAVAGGGRVLHGIPPDLADQLRRLHYTPHTVQGDHATCTECGHERRYGRSW